MPGIEKQQSLLVWLIKGAHSSDAVDIDMLPGPGGRKRTIILEHLLQAKHHDKHFKPLNLFISSFRDKKMILEISAKTLTGEEIERQRN